MGQGLDASGVFVRAAYANFNLFACAAGLPAISRLAAISARVLPRQPGGKERCAQMLGLMAKNCSQMLCRAARQGSILLNHHLGGFNDHLYRIALLQLEFFGTVARDNAFDQVVPDLYDNVSHDVADLNVLNFAGQLVSSGESHM